MPNKMLLVINNFYPGKMLCFYHSLLLFIGIAVVQRRPNHAAGLGTAQAWSIRQTGIIQGKSEDVRIQRNTKRSEII